MPLNSMWPDIQSRINHRINSPGSCSGFGKVSSAFQNAMSNQQYAASIKTLKMTFQAPPMIGRALVDFATQPLLEHHPHFRPTNNQKELPGYWFARDIVKQPDLTSWELDHDSYDVLLIYIHGGAFFVGHALMYSTFMSNLVLDSNLRIRIYTIEYELANKKRPETQYPYQHRTAFYAYIHLLSMGVPASKIVIGGDSSGGFNTLKTFEYIVDENVPKPTGVLLNSPLIDLWFPEDKAEKLARLGPGNSLELNSQKDYVGSHFLQNGLDDYKPPSDSAPINRGIRGNWFVEHLPPTFMAYGTNEVLLDYVTGFKQEMEKGGADLVVFEGKDEAHVFNVMEKKYSRDKRSWEEAHVALVRWLGRFGKGKEFQ